MEKRLINTNVTIVIVVITVYDTKTLNIMPKYQYKESEHTLVKGEKKL
jgi:hypothetical protein